MININITDLAANALINLHEKNSMNSVELTELLLYGDSIKKTFVSRGVPCKILSDSRFVSDLQYRETKNFSYNELEQIVILKPEVNVEKFKEELISKLSMDVIEVMDEPFNLEVLGIRNTKRL